MQPHHPHQPGTNEDFGIRPDKAIENAKRHERDYSGRPAGDKLLGVGESVRVHGVGSTAGGRGKGSGGDVDPDLLGIEPVPGRLPPMDGKKHTVGGGQAVDGHVSPFGADATMQVESQSGGGVANNRGWTENDAFVSELTEDDATGNDEKND